MWHARVAWVMRKLQQPDEAMKEINKALEMDATSWRLLMVKAKILANQEKWQDAIEIMTLSNKMLESDSVQMKKNSDEYWENKLFLAEWLRDLGQKEKSLETYNSCFEHDPEDYDLLPPILRIPLEKDDYSSAMKFLRALNEAKTPKSGHSRLVHSLMALKDEESFHFDIVETARRNQALDMVQAAYNDALSIATSKNRPGQTAWMQYYQGLLFERYLYQRDEAQKVWENIVRDSSNAVKGTALFKVRDWVIRELCNLYIEKVIHLGKGSPVAEKYALKVRDMSAGDASLLWQYDTATALGVLHRLMGEDEKAKKCFRGRVKLGFDLLTDKDPTNDYAAYYLIAQEVLALAGPDCQKDCLAAYSLLGIHEKVPEADVSKTETVSEEPSGVESKLAGTESRPAEVGTEGVETEPRQAETELKVERAGTDASQPGQPPRRPTLPTFLPSQTKEFATAETMADWRFVNCDGCDKELNIPDNTFVCTLCLDMNFCADCQAELKSNTLGFRICSPKHDLLHIPAAPGPLPKDMVRYDNEYVPILDWLSRLKKTWGL
jgi:tetratricopeptide (TPR) repeat protein